MYRVRLTDDRVEWFFNRKENAIGKTKRIYHAIILEEFDNIFNFNEWMKDENAYENIMKAIETEMPYTDDIIILEEIKTAD